MKPSYRSARILPAGVSRHSLGLLTLALSVLLLASACSISLAEDVTPPPGYRAPVPATQPAASAASLSRPDRPPDPGAGAPLYTEKCAPCHGDTGLGDGSQAAQLPNPATPIGDQLLASQSIPLEWYSVITNGRLDRFMPPFINGLTDQERWDVLAYVYTFSIPPDALAAGEVLYQANCLDCHGAAGDGVGASLGAGEVPDFSDPAVMATRSAVGLFDAISAGVAPSMPAYAGQLDEDSRWSLAYYVRALGYQSSAQPVAAGPETAASPEPGGTPESVDQENPLDTVLEGPATVMGTITGMVNNGSGGDVPEGLEITLHGFDHITEVYTTTTTTAPDGSFKFENVDMLPSRIYLVTADYNQAVYNSDLGIVEPDIDEMDLPITIFETTTDTSLLVVDRLHMFVESVSSDLLQVTELYLISNPSDRVVVAPEDGEPVVEYSVPAEAVNLRFQDESPEGRYLPSADGFGDTAGIPPGTSQHQVMFAYDLPYDRAIDLSRPHELPVNAVILLMPDIGIQLKSDQLQDTGPRDIQGEIFQVYTGDRIAADQPLVFSLSGSVTGADTGAALVNSGSQTGLIIGLVAFGVTLIFAGIWLFRRNQTAWQEVPDHEPEIGFNGSPEHIADAIIALDDLYQAGDLPEEAYRQRRAELKAELKARLSKDNS